MIPMINHLGNGMAIQLPEPLDPTTCTYALVDPQGNVINVIMWDGQSDYKPPHGHQLVQNRGASIGDIFDGKNFTKPIATPIGAGNPPTAP